MSGLNINLPNGASLCQVGPVQGFDLYIGLSEAGAYQENQGIYSPGRTCRLFAQADGNFVLQYVETADLPWTNAQQNWTNETLDPSAVTWVTYWATNTAWNEVGDAGPVASNFMVLQPDGNLVVYDANKAAVGSPAGAVFSSRTPGNPGAFLRLQDDGNLVLLNSSGVTIWNSNTSIGESKGANVELKRAARFGVKSIAHFATLNAPMSDWIKKKLARTQTHK